MPGFNNCSQDGIGGMPYSHSFSSLLTAPREVFSPTGADEDSEDEDSDPNTLAAQMGRQVEAMRAEGS